MTARRSPPGQTAGSDRSATSNDVHPSEKRSCVPPFDISAVTSIDRPGALKATFDVTLPGITLRACRLVVTASRKFVSGPTSKAPWVIGGWATHAEFDDDLGEALLAAIVARLDAIAVQDAVT
ncbi:MAG: hypothetical protein GIX03_05475 [Candidatus Eremiobacteraeota bacterium]|nr:hypothetical protein [Candidatus Eremiobacteraeota bacterium]MBC5802447.1 hypothetical protein [Candidatus Eremiobacteraeota bacterium]MBC5822901.1 hypothetical protein [Candidatus Eremiobacteraeota bacterium]